MRPAPKQRLSPFPGCTFDNDERPPPSGKIHRQSDIGLPARHDSLAGQSAFADRRSAPALPSVLRCACPPSPTFCAASVRQASRARRNHFTTDTEAHPLPCRVVPSFRKRRPPFSDTPFHADDLVPRCHAPRGGNDSIGATLPCLFLIAVLPAMRPEPKQRLCPFPG